MSKKISILEKRKLLKKAGFIRQDLRKKPTKNNLKIVEKNWTKYGRYTGENYASKKLDKKATALYKSAGYMVKAGRTYVNKEGYSRVYFGKKTITKTKNKKKKTDYLLRKNELLPELERRLSKPLPKGSYITAKIGDNGTFGNPVLSAGIFEQYIKNSFNAKMTQIEQVKYDKMSKKQKKVADKKRDKLTQELISQMSLVTLNHKPPVKQNRRKNKTHRRK